MDVGAMLLPHQHHGFVRAGYALRQQVSPSEVLRRQPWILAFQGLRILLSPGLRVRGHQGCVVVVDGEAVVVVHC